MSSGVPGGMGCRCWRTTRRSPQRLALIGPAGAGKTWTALLLARELARVIQAWLSEGAPAPASNPLPGNGQPPDRPDKAAMLEAIKEVLRQVAPGDTDETRTRRLALIRDSFSCEGHQQKGTEETIATTGKSTPHGN